MGEITDALREALAKRHAEEKCPACGGVTLHRQVGAAPALVQCLICGETHPPNAPSEG